MIVLLRVEKSVRELLCAARLLTLLTMVSMTAGCAFYVPPFSNIDMDRARTISVGVSTADDLRAALGKPKGLDTPEFKVYSAHHNYGTWGFFVPVMVAPVGGGGTIKDRDMIVAAQFDSAQTLQRLDGIVAGQNIQPVAPTTGRAVITQYLGANGKQQPAGTSRILASDDGRTLAIRLPSDQIVVQLPGSDATLVDSAPLVGNRPNAIALSANGSLLALAGKGVAVIDLRTHQTIFDSRSLTDGKQTFSSVALVGSGPMVIARNRKAELLRWDAATKASLPPMEAPHGEPRGTMAVASDGSRVAGIVHGSVSGAVWNARTGAIEAQLPKRSSMAGGIAFLERDGSRLALAFPSHIEIYRLDRSAADGARLEDVLPLPPSVGTGGPQLVSDVATGRLIAQGDETLVFDWRTRTLVSRFKGVLFTDDSGNERVLPVACATFGGASNDLLLATYKGVFATSFTGGQDLQLPMQWFDRK